MKNDQDRIGNWLLKLGEIALCARGPAVIIPALLLLTSCATARTPTVIPTAALTDEAATLGSLQQVDDYPLYAMHYRGPYSATARLPVQDSVAGVTALDGCGAAWGCSLFAAVGDPNARLLGRNFDWEFSPALLLFTDPQDGYAAVSMVDIAYLGFDGERAKHLEELSLEGRRPLLDAPSLAFDGMNEKGIAVGMAAVPEQPMPHHAQHETINELQAIREILDHAATVEEAVAILDGHNIDMGSVPIHYLIASASGESALVEFYEGRMVVFRNQQEWQTATNFLVASTGGNAAGRCPRYDRMSRRLEDLQGRIAAGDAMRLLDSVSQDNTQWSVLYHMTSGDIEVIMGREYGYAAHRFHLEPGAG